VLIDPRRNPARPKVLTTGEVPQEARLSYQHNSLRPNATRWRPRAKGDKSRGLRPGELVLANGETNFKPQCDGTSNGPFATWSARDFNRGVPLRPLHVFRPRHNGTYADGDPTVNVLGCSGHWFTERRGLVAAGWYEHGTRFLKVNPKTGSIAEVGWFVPAAGSTSAAHWINDEYVYTVDYSRGIDVLRIDRKAKPPTRAQLDASWGRTANRGLAFFRQREQSLCRMATDRVS
jgi:hypothetical protein